MPTSLLPYDDVIAIARPIVERIIWCTVTTVSPAGAPRSRLMHPVWFWDGDNPFALVTARPTPIKVRHLSAQPGVACFYWDPNHDTVAIDATATWLDPSERDDAWRRISEVPAPVGFDPAIIWPDGPGTPDCTFLRFEAHRVVVNPVGGPGTRWNLSSSTPSSASTHGPVMPKPTETAQHREARTLTCNTGTGASVVQLPEAVLNVSPLKGWSSHRSRAAQVGDSGPRT